MATYPILLPPSSFFKNHQSAKTRQAMRSIVRSVCRLMVFKMGILDCFITQSVTQQWWASTEVKAHQRYGHVMECASPNHFLFWRVDHGRISKSHSASTQTHTRLQLCNSLVSQTPQYCPYGRDNLVFPSVISLSWRRASLSQCHVLTQMWESGRKGVYL